MTTIMNSGLKNHFDEIVIAWRILCAARSIFRTSARGELNFWWRENGWFGGDCGAGKPGIGNWVEMELDPPPGRTPPPDRVPPPGGETFSWYPANFWLPWPPKVITWTAPNHNPLLINIIHHHRHDGEEGLSPAVLPLLDPPFAAADLILVPGTLRYIIVVIIFVRATMRITSLRSCSTSLMVIAGKVESGTGETAAEGRTLPPARLGAQQRPLGENRENDRDGRDVPFLPLRRRHSCPLRLARSAPMQRAGLTHTPDVPSELVQVLGVDVEGDGGKVEDEEVDGEDIEDTWRGQVGPHSPQWPCPPMWPPVLSVLVLKIPGSCFLIRIGICCFPTCTSNGPGGLHRLCNRSSRSPGRRTAIHMPGIQWS